MSHFEFLAHEWPQIYESAIKSELAATGDPRTACIYARRALELQVDWMYEHDPVLSRPYQNDLSALIHEPSFKRQAFDALFQKPIYTDFEDEALSQKAPRPYRYSQAPQQ